MSSVRHRVECPAADAAAAAVEVADVAPSSALHIGVVGRSRVGLGACGGALNFGRDRYWGQSHEQHRRVSSQHAACLTKAYSRIKRFCSVLSSAAAAYVSVRAASSVAVRRHCYSYLLRGRRPTASKALQPRHSFICSVSRTQYTPSYGFRNTAWLRSYAQSAQRRWKGSCFS